MEAAIIAGAVRLGSRRAVDVIREALDRAERAQGLAAFSSLQPEHALERASQIDAQVAAGKNPGRLAGVPIAIKDNIAQAGMPMTAASRILEGYTAPSTATALSRLEAEGAIVIGRTNMDEFDDRAREPASDRRPIPDTDHVPGGSSSGSSPPSPRELCRWLWVGHRGSASGCGRAPGNVVQAHLRPHQPLWALGSPPSTRSGRWRVAFVMWRSRPTSWRARRADSTTLSDAMG